MRVYHGIVPKFDDPNLVSDGGLVPLLELAELAGLSSLVDECSSLEVPALAAKVRTVVAGMAAGADCIDDLDRLRAGGTDRLIVGVRAPSTIGTFLRSVTNGGHVDQFGKVNRKLLTNLALNIPSLIDQSNDLVFVDIDDTVKEVHGHRKQAAGFGYTKVRGLNAMITVASTSTSHPVITDCQLRKGNTRSGHGAARQLARAITTVKGFDPTNRNIWVRGDSAFCTSDNVAAVTKTGAWFSFTTQQWPTVSKAIAEIPENAWIPIQYPNAIIDEETGELISEAEVAEIPYLTFSSKPDLEIPCRLIVRRVVRKSSLELTGQAALFPDYRHHAFITNAPFTTVDADRFHRRHAIVEQVICELKNGPLAHLPSGNYFANALWLTFAAIAFNLTRAAAHLALMADARTATVRTKIISVPARIATTGRQVFMHLPKYWPWASGWERFWQTITLWPPPTRP